MKKSLHQVVIQKVRGATPLRIRQKIGPVISFVLYVFNTRVRKNRKIPKVLPIKDTVDLIVKKKLSVIRFGDGEISLIDGLNLGFQKRDRELSNKLEVILRTNKEGLLICIPGIWDRLENFKSYAYWFNMHHLYRYGHVWKNVLSYNAVYGDTNITRSYLAYVDRSDCNSIFKSIFSIWNASDVILVEGEKSRLGVGNDMFNSVKSLKRILCPPENAFEKYEEIKKEVLKNDKDKLILVSLGPTAKVLAYDLFLLNYRVVDIGHVDMEYEMFLRGETKQTKVEFKYFNEINERDPEECKDEKYLSQIIANIK